MSGINAESEMQKFNDDICFHFKAIERSKEGGEAVSPSNTLERSLISDNNGMTLIWGGLGGGVIA